MGQDLFNERFIDALKQSKKTQKQIADEVSVTEQTISKWKNSSRQINPLFLPRLAKALNVSLMWLCGGTDNQNQLTYSENIGQKELLKNLSEASKHALFTYLKLKQDNNYSISLRREARKRLCSPKRLKGVN